MGKWAVLAVVFNIRYFSLGTGEFRTATVWFGDEDFTLAQCKEHAAQVARQPDPAGYRTELACVVDDGTVRSLLLAPVKEE